MGSKKLEIIKKIIFWHKLTENPSENGQNVKTIFFYQMAAILDQNMKIVKIPASLFNTLPRGCSIFMYSFPNALVIKNNSFLAGNHTPPPIPLNNVNN